MPCTRCVATWLSHSAGTSYATGLQASRLQPDGCDPSFSIFFFSEQPRRTSPRNSHMRLAVISRDPHPHQATLWENSQFSGIYSGNWSRIASRAAHRASITGAAQPHFSRFRSIPQVGHNPAQSIRHNGASGSSIRTVSRTIGAKSI